MFDTISIYPPMRRDLRDKWIAALRSGEYKQGQSKLYNEKNNTYCCLGVLERVCGNEPEDLIEVGNGVICFSKDLNNPKAPEEFWGEEDNTIAHELACMNDGSKGKPMSSFEEIAKFIEEKIPVIE